MQACGNIPSHRPRPEDGRKYLELGDFSPQAAVERNYASKLDPHKHRIDAWLAEDKRTWRKQHHTAQRIHGRLAEEIPGYDCSYSLVQRYVKEERRARGGQCPKGQARTQDRARVWPQG